MVILSSVNYQTTTTRHKQYLVYYCWWLRFPTAFPSPVSVFPSPSPTGHSSSSYPQWRPFLVPWRGWLGSGSNPANQDWCREVSQEYWQSGGGDLAGIASHNLMLVIQKMVGWGWKLTIYLLLLGHPCCVLDLQALFASEHIVVLELNSQWGPSGGAPSAGSVLCQQPWLTGDPVLEFPTPVCSQQFPRYITLVTMVTTITTWAKYTFSFCSATCFTLFISSSSMVLDTLSVAMLLSSSFTCSSDSCRASMQLPCSRAATTSSSRHLQRPLSFLFTSI